MRISALHKPALMLLAILAVAGIAISAAAATEREDGSRHADYYYPPLTSDEVYTARALVMSSASREFRLGFVTGLTQQQLARPYSPAYSIFAKGEIAEKMIIVSLGQHGFKGLYQARGLLAQLTAVARGSPLFRESAVEDLFTFLDLARMLGFDELTISDGESFAHRIELR